MGSILVKYKEFKVGYPLLRSRVNKPMLSVNMGLIIMYVLVGLGASPSTGVGFTVGFILTGAFVNLACAWRIIKVACKLGASVL